jgi:RNase adaptor protein for sRNA GlmZ degradation
VEEKMKKIVIIRGKVTAGKTTTSHELAKVLPGWILIDPWKIKEMFEPLGLENREPLKKASKKAIIEIMKVVIRDIGINIIVQETTQKFIKKYLRKDIKSKDYKIYSFFLDVELKDAVKRDIQRDKPTMHLGKGVKNEEEWKKRILPDREDFIINTSKNTIKQVRDIILKQINEKPRKNPNADLIRKCW